MKYVRLDGFQPARTGFTLLETMLALLLSSVLLAAIYSAMDQSWRVSSSGREEMERAQLARALIHKIEVDIRAITFVPPPPVEETDSTSTTTTSGSSSGSSGGGTSSGGSSSGGSSSGSKSGGSSGSGSSSGSKSGSSTGASSGGSASSGSSTSSSSSTDTETALPNSKSIGIRGTNQKMEMSIARPRRDLLPGTTASAGASRTSDLRAVAYSFNATGTSTVSGLVRTEGDRMAVEVLEAGGGSGLQTSNVQMLAPEVSNFLIRYFDGRVWSASWDSDTAGRIPRAVEVTVTFYPSRRKRGLFSSAVSQSMDSFRTVISIPVSDPFPKEFLP